jgi:hypothetical protein
MRTTRLLAALVAAALLLAGCGGSPKPSTLPSRTPTPSPSVSPSRTPPALPDAAKANSRAGATAFIAHYIDVLNFVTFGGNVEAAKSLDNGRCKSCNNMLGAIASIYAQGGRVDGGAWAATILDVLRHPDHKAWTVDTKISYGPQTVVRKTGAKPEHYSGGGRVVTFILTYSSGTWKVAEWTRAT